MKRHHRPAKRIAVDSQPEEKVARHKLSLLELATELSNVSKACKIMGYCQQQFYEIRRNFQLYGTGSRVTVITLYLLDPQELEPAV